MGAEIKLKNVAQIASGKFNLTDLTLFVGPNNSGKSVAAICAYAASRAATPSNLFEPVFPPRSYSGEAEYLSMNGVDWSEERVAEAVDQMVLLIERLGEKDSAKLRLPAIVREYAQVKAEQTLRIYGSRVADELERCFGTRLSGIARRQSKNGSSLVIRSGSLGWVVEIDLRGKRKGRVKVLKLPDVRVAALSALAGIAGDGSTYKARRSHVTSDFAWLLAWVLLKRDFPKRAQYLPAERSGILQGHRLLAGAVLRRAPYVGIERIDMPQMSGVITDFMTQILEIDEVEQSQRAADFGAVADSLEKRVLEGSIQIDRKDQGYPEISFRQGKATFPLHRVSSMVTELAPIVLYLRNQLHKEDLFIIEEPESHLHPKNQIHVAEAITQLYTQGLRLLVTTHSDYFLAAISNGIRSCAVGGNGLDGSPIKPLDPDRVSAYVFKPSRTRGSTMKPLEISPHDGIDEEEFGRVTEALYRETVQLEDLIGAQQSDN